MKYSVMKGGATLLALLSLSAHGADAPEAGPATLRAIRACKPDIRQYCPNVPSGDGRILACLEKHESTLDVPCRKVIEHVKARKAEGKTPAPS
ncbi:cysteine rich repeat-containing protein [Paludibacterium yongneupense]|uniref:cysteine rich repeat-containing protein n=1 Tax=Paludibacterium yongneupense TaxID=400061 RepID=UPI000429B74A|nr:cysteine rich repeat-containing protein [Paludibacterium yongneupense]